MPRIPSILTPNAARAAVAAVAGVFAGRRDSAASSVVTSAASTPSGLEDSTGSLGQSYGTDGGAVTAGAPRERPSDVAGPLSAGANRGRIHLPRHPAAPVAPGGQLPVIAEAPAASLHDGGVGFGFRPDPHFVPRIPLQRGVSAPADLNQQGAAAQVSSHGSQQPGAPRSPQGPQTAR